jgi:hypothetical protein
MIRRWRRSVGSHAGRRRRYAQGWLAGRLGDARGSLTAGRRRERLELQAQARQLIAASSHEPLQADEERGVRLVGGRQCLNQALDLGDLLVDLSDAPRDIVDLATAAMRGQRRLHDSAPGPRRTVLAYRRRGGRITAAASTIASQKRRGR